eukprot:gene6222-biopygen1280
MNLLSGTVARWHGGTVEPLCTTGGSRTGPLLHRWLIDGFFPLTETHPRDFNLLPAAHRLNIYRKRLRTPAVFRCAEDELVRKGKQHHFAAYIRVPRKDPLDKDYLNRTAGANMPYRRKHRPKSPRSAGSFFVFRGPLRRNVAMDPRLSLMEKSVLCGWAFHPRCRYSNEQWEVGEGPRPDRTCPPPPPPPLRAACPPHPAQSPPCRRRSRTAVPVCALRPTPSPPQPILGQCRTGQNRQESIGHPENAPGVDWGQEQDLTGSSAAPQKKKQCPRGRLVLRAATPKWGRGSTVAERSKSQGPTRPPPPSCCDRGPNANDARAAWRRILAPVAALLHAELAHGAARVDPDHGLYPAVHDPEAVLHLHRHWSDRIRGVRRLLPRLHARVRVQHPVFCEPKIRMGRGSSPAIQRRSRGPEFGVPNVRSAGTKLCLYSSALVNKAAHSYTWCMVRKRTMRKRSCDSFLRPPSPPRHVGASPSDRRIRADIFPDAALCITFVYNISITLAFGALYYSRSPSMKTSPKGTVPCQNVFVDLRPSPRSRTVFTHPGTDAPDRNVFIDLMGGQSDSLSRKVGVRNRSWSRSRRQSRRVGKSARSESRGREITIGKSESESRSRQVQVGNSGLGRRSRKSESESRRQMWVGVGVRVQSESESEVTGK